MFVLAISVVLGGLCGCATKVYPPFSGDNPEDQQISARVSKALGDDGLYRYKDVEVITQNGVTELKGYVNSWEAQQHAGDVARFTKGVKQVRNDLILK